MSRVLLPSLLALSAVPCAAYPFSAGETGIVLSDDTPRAPVVGGLSYTAVDDGGTVFTTTGARLEGDSLRFDLDGPGAEQASVEATVTRLSRGVALDFSIRCSGPARQWNPWTSGLRFSYGRPITDAYGLPVTKWVVPTGAQPWEVAGDTPYPDTECHLRHVILGDTALVLVAPSYDPDWIYGNNKDRAVFSRLSLPAEENAELRYRLVLLPVPAVDLDPTRLAAEAAGRPVCVDVRTDRTGNLFSPGEPVAFEYELGNVTAEPQACSLQVDAYDYRGQELCGEKREFDLAPLAREVSEHRLQTDLRGVVFVAARLSWAGGEQVVRKTLGILPEREAEAVAPESPFGMAAVIANPASYPDHHDLSTVLPLMERIGVRWIRGGWFPLKQDISSEDDARVREKVALLAEHGILPHVQLGSGVPAAEELEVFEARLAASLERFGWVTPYVEVGNELNHGGVGGREYVEKLLRPVHDVMRRVVPEARAMSMGLGGVQQSWLGDFCAAGGMDLVDILSIHPGSHPKAPEFWEGWRGWVFRPQVLDSLQAAREAGGKEVWITEVYAPTPPQRSQVDVRTSADYLVRTYVCAIAAGVRVTEWYQFQDGVWFAQRPRPDDIEYSFGVVYTDLSPKPAYVAFGAMTQQLEGATCEGRLDLGADDLYAVRFSRAGETVDVLWSYREKHETDLPWWPPEKYEKDSRRPAEPWTERWQAPVAVELPAAGIVTVTDLMGNAREVPVRDGNVTLSLTGSPVYVRGLGEMKRLPQLWPEG